MENIHIVGSHDVFFVPSVNFDADSGICELAGESYLEETVEFYTPLIQWLKTYIEEESRPLTFNIKLTYFNTSSSRCILDILNIIKVYEENGGTIIVNWYFDPDDTDMEEEIEDYMIDSEIKISLIPF